MGLTWGAGSARGWVVAFASLGLSVLSGCNHCTTIDERICADLGADCSIWRSDETLRSLVIPANERRRRVREGTCEALGDDAIYASRTLPMVKNYIVHLRNPRAPQARIPMGPPPTSGAGYLYYLLTPIAILGAMGYATYHRKVVMPAHVAKHQAAVSASVDAQARAMAEWNAKQAADRAASGSGNASGGGA